MADFAFDTVLSRSDADDVVRAVAALYDVRRLSGRGVSQSRGEGHRFQFAVDEAQQWWVLVSDNGRRQTYRNGFVDLGGVEPPRESEFFASMPKSLRMLWPLRMLTWGRGRESFSPVLVQPVGRRSLLFTFEHVDDPAFRQTLVIDRHTGIAKRMVGYDQAIIVTAIDDLDAWSPDELPHFEPVTGPVPTDY
ncbi:hypothetical protein N3K63_10945 [Microbacterium sp. W1N]|uniref:hypothetical protein n=1 Tax=Microbacterium festucae TaxID=2977531 RepID=UPI0021C234F2|nr:hypothetical protein [Microbacterium festucae]MCT9820800.1 hypothetical protein [Microbacterium festucae]